MYLLGLRDANSLPCLLQLLNLKVVGLQMELKGSLYRHPSSWRWLDYHIYIFKLHIKHCMIVSNFYTILPLPLNIIDFEFHPDYTYILLYGKIPILSCLFWISVLSSNISIKLPDFPHKSFAYLLLDLGGVCKSCWFSPTLTLWHSLFPFSFL